MTSDNSFETNMAKRNVTFSTNCSHHLITAFVPSLTQVLLFLQQPKKGGIAIVLFPQLRSLGTFLWGFVQGGHEEAW